MYVNFHHMMIKDMFLQVASYLKLTDQLEKETDS